MKDALLLRGLPGETVSEPQHLVGAAGRQRIAGEAGEPRALLDVDRADLRPKVIGEEREGVFPQLVQGLLSLQSRGEPRLAGAHPGLRLPRAVFPGGDEGRREGEEQQQRRPARRDRRRVAGGAARGALPVDQPPPLVEVHVGDNGADAVHRQLSLFGAHDRQRALEVTGLAQRDGSRQLIHLDRQEALHLRDALLLRQAVGGESAQGRQLAWQGHLRVSVDVEIAVLAHQQVAALPGLRVLDEGEEEVETIQRLRRPLHGIRRGVAGLHRAQGEERGQQHGQDRDREPGEGVWGEPSDTRARGFRRFRGLVHRRRLRIPAGSAGSFVAYHTQGRVAPDQGRSASAGTVN